MRPTEIRYESARIHANVGAMAAVVVVTLAVLFDVLVFRWGADSRRPGDPEDKWMPHSPMLQCVWDLASRRAR